MEKKFDTRNEDQTDQIPADFPRPDYAGAIETVPNAVSSKVHKMTLFHRLAEESKNAIQ